MDNDNKVEVQRHNEVLLFLNEELKKLQIEDEIDSYNLEKEYAKTKKNRPVKTIIMLIATVLAVILSVVIIDVIISKQNQEIVVNLQEFDSMNLKDLLDSVSKVQTGYDNAVKNKTNLHAQQEIEIQEVNSNYEKDLFVLNSLNLRSKREYESRLKKLDEEKNNSIKEITEKYIPLFTAADKEIEEYKQQLVTFDSEKVNSAMQQEKALNSERELRELENKKLTSNYEARLDRMEKTLEETKQQNKKELFTAVKNVQKEYEDKILLLDPIINNPEDAALIEKTRKRGTAISGFFVIKNFLPEDYHQTNPVKNQLISDQYKRYTELFNQYQQLDRPFLTISYRNSLGDYVKAKHNIVSYMAQAYAEDCNTIDNMVTELNTQVSQLNKQITDTSAAYENAMMNLMQSEKISSLILFVDSADKIRVLVVPALQSAIKETGVAAEVKLDKVVRGVIYPDESGFYFVPNDQVKLDAITPGMTIKILK